MLGELGAIARTKHDHLDGNRIALVFEEQGEILRFDITELDGHEGISTKPCVTRLRKATAWQASDM